MQNLLDEEVVELEHQHQSLTPYTNFRHFVCLLCHKSLKLSEQICHVHHLEAFSRLVSLSSAHL